MPDLGFLLKTERTKDTHQGLKERIKDTHQGTQHAPNNSKHPTARTLYIQHAPTQQQHIQQQHIQVRHAPNNSIPSLLECIKATLLGTYTTSVTTFKPVQATHQGKYLTAASHRKIPSRLSRTACLLP